MKEKVQEKVMSSGKVERRVEKCYLYKSIDHTTSYLTTFFQKCQKHQMKGEEHMSAVRMVREKIIHVTMKLRILKIECQG